MGKIGVESKVDQWLNDNGHMVDNNNYCFVGDWVRIDDDVVKPQIV